MYKFQLDKLQIDKLFNWMTLQQKQQPTSYNKGKPHRQQIIKTTGKASWQFHCSRLLFLQKARSCFYYSKVTFLSLPFLSSFFPYLPFPFFFFSFNRAPFSVSWLCSFYEHNAKPHLTVLLTHLANCSRWANCRFPENSPQIHPKLY